METVSKDLRSNQRTMAGRHDPLMRCPSEFAKYIFGLFQLSQGDAEDLSYFLHDAAVSLFPGINQPVSDAELLAAMESASSLIKSFLEKQRLHAPKSSPHATQNEESIRDQLKDEIGRFTCGEPSARVFLDCAIGVIRMDFKLLITKRGRPSTNLERKSQKFLSYSAGILLERPLGGGSPIWAEVCKQIRSEMLSDKLPTTSQEALKEVLSKYCKFNGSDMQRLVALTGFELRSSSIRT